MVCLVLFFFIGKDQNVHKLCVRLDVLSYSKVTDNRKIVDNLLVGLLCVYEESEDEEIYRMYTMYKRNYMK